MTNHFRPADSFRKDTERTLILVDWSNLMYRAWFVSREQPWVAFCKFFDMLRLCVHKSKQPGVPIGIIFAGESRTPLKRMTIYPEYKGGRRYTKNEDFLMFRKQLEVYIEAIGYELLRIDGAEADDVIASIVNKLCHRCYCKVPCVDCDCAKKFKTDIVIFSGDRDLQQLLAWDRVLIYRAPGLFIDRADFEEELKIPIAKYGVYKALIGDKSDNISGVEGFGPVKAQLAIQAGSVAEDIWEMSGTKGAEQFRLALKLVNLDTKLEVDLDAVYTDEPRIEETRCDDKGRAIDRRIIFEIKRFGEEFQNAN